MRLRTLALLTGLLAAFATVSAPAHASTGGTPDGDLHPGVGYVTAYADGVRYRCTATLVAPTVLLSAAHCFEGADGKVGVRFDSVLAEQPPLPLPPAADLEAGYSSAELEAAGWASGTAHLHPAYSGLTDVRNWNDVSVVVLDRPVIGVKPAPLAGLGALDALPGKGVSGTLFRAVGYGTEVRKPETGPQKAVPMSFPLLRRYVDMTGQKLSEQILQTNGNALGSSGTGETCTGDSGGPVYLGEEVVAVTSYSNGSGDKCRSTEGFQRVDIPVVRQWLATFGL